MLNPEDGAIYFITVCQQRTTAQRSLTSPELAQALLTSFQVPHQQDQWYCRLVLLMPDHVHALISPGTKTLKQAIHDWKHFTSRSLGIEWQTDYFDHRLRKAESLQDKADYILNNPVRAGLVEKPEGWPHVWIT